MSDYDRVQMRAVRLEQRNAELVDENQKLAAEVARLKNALKLAKSDNEDDGA
jgi:hypothetical protein